MVNKYLRDNRDTCIAMVIPIAILAKLVEHLFLPEKYYFDNHRILYMVNVKNYAGAWEGSYRVASDFFSRINIFGFNTMLQWSVFLGIICNIIVLWMLKKSIKGLDIKQCLFVLMCIGLCNIYIFNIGKDLIQFLIFLLCFLIVTADRLPYTVRVLLCVTAFYWESTFFRSYYIIIAAFIVVVYLIFKIVRTKKIKLNFVNILFVIAMLYLCMYIFLNIARIAMPEDYTEILECKNMSTQLGATSVIADKIDFGTNVNLYMVNYIINSIRMVFPIELINAGVFYFPFFIFQILLLYYIVVNIKNIHSISNKNIIGLSCFLAYFMGSVLFEPDFGSFVRHEAGTFPVILLLFANDNMLIENNRD